MNNNIDNSFRNLKEDNLESTTSSNNDEDIKILTMVYERIKQSKPMPKEFSKIVDEDFWDLII